MREIKARVWNTIANCWASEYELEQILFINPNTLGKGFEINERKGNGLAVDIGTTFVVQFYIGKNDTDSKGIYEGDIVEITTYSYIEPISLFTAVVSYSE